MGAYAAKRDEQAERVVALARSLTAAEWTSDSLCAGWRACDVLGHLTASATVGLAPTVGSIVRHRSIDRAEYVDAVELASTCTQAELVDRLDAARANLVGPARAFPARMIWADLVIHELDVRWPLGTAGDVDPTLVAGVLDVLLALPNPFVPARPRAKGLGLRAADVEWSHGTGPEVVGPASSILLAVAGRPAGLAELRGDGVEVLAGRLGEAVPVQM